MSKLAAPRSDTRPSRRTPQRTCVACRTTTDKRDLVRLVRTPEGHVTPDPSGKALGRGAYLCTKQSCWEDALKTGVLARALRVPITEADVKQIGAYGHTLGEGAAT